jgi:predicted amidohydrolase
VQADSVEPVDTTPTLQGCDTPIPEIGDGGCALQQGSADLLLQGNVMLPHGIQANAAVLISDGLITCVGCDCLDLPAATAATRLICPQGVISQGLINAHDHIGWTHVAPVAHGAERYDHRHEWRKGKNGKTKLSVGSSGGKNQKIWGELLTGVTGSEPRVSSRATLPNRRGLAALTYSVETDVRSISAQNYDELSEFTPKIRKPTKSMLYCVRYFLRSLA